MALIPRITSAMILVVQILGLLILALNISMGIFRFRSALQG